MYTQPDQPSPEEAAEVEVDIQRDVEQEIAQRIGEGWTVQYRGQYNVIFHQRGLDMPANIAVGVLDVLILFAGLLLFWPALFALLIHPIVWAMSIQKMQLWVDDEGLIQTAPL